jgi:osmoprotectant transport system ATP-binding protein
VERFIGEDRALRRLALHRVGDVPLGPVQSQTPDMATMTASATVRNAVSLLLGTGSGEVLVVGDDGAPVGVLTLERATALLRS